MCLREQKQQEQQKRKKAQLRPRYSCRLKYAFKDGSTIYLSQSKDKTTV